MSDTIKRLIPRMVGGIEKVDIETGQVVIRHPTKQTLSIRTFPRETAVRILGWHTARMVDRNYAPMIQDVFPELSADDREELLSGLTGKEFDEAFPDDEPTPPKAA